MLLDESLLEGLMEQAAESERRRMNFDLRTGAGDGSQRMLNALLPGTVVPIHRHRDTAETVIVLSGRLTEVFYEVEEAGASLGEPSCGDAAPCEEMACGADAAAGAACNEASCGGALACEGAFSCEAAATGAVGYGLSSRVPEPYGDAEAAAAGMHEETLRCGSTPVMLTTLASGTAVRVREVARYDLCPAAGRYGIQIPKGVWHTVIAYEPGILFEAKDGAFHPAFPEDMISPHATAQILSAADAARQPTTTPAYGQGAPIIVPLDYSANASVSNVESTKIDASDTDCYDISAATRTEALAASMLEAVNRCDTAALISLIQQISPADLTSSHILATAFRIATSLLGE